MIAHPLIYLLRIWNIPKRLIGEYTFLIIKRNLFLSFPVNVNVSTFYNLRENTGQGEFIH